MLTCKDFLAELSDYLDEHTDSQLKADLEAHMQLCPNCWVVCDTTRKTIKVFKGQSQCCSVPTDVASRLMAVFERAKAGKAE